MDTNKYIANEHHNCKEMRCGQVYHSHNSSECDLSGSPHSYALNWNKVVAYILDVLIVIFTIIGSVGALVVYYLYIAGAE